jgi:hypothetical protein
MLQLIPKLIQNLAKLESEILYYLFILLKHIYQFVCLRLRNGDLSNISPIPKPMLPKIEK